MSKHKVQTALNIYGLHYGGLLLFILGIALLIAFGWGFWLGYVVIILGIVLFAIDHGKYTKYLDIITHTGELAVDGIAAQVGEDIETTKKMLKEMLKKNILTGWLDEEKLELKLTEWPGGDNEDDEDGEKYFHPAIKYTHIKDVICPNCGAKMEIGTD